MENVIIATTVIIVSLIIILMMEVKLAALVGVTGYTVKQKGSAIFGTLMIPVVGIGTMYFITDSLMASVAAYTHYIVIFLLFYYVPMFYIRSSWITKRIGNIYRVIAEYTIPLSVATAVEVLVPPISYIKIFWHFIVSLF